MTFKIQTHPPTYLSVTGQKMPKINETVLLLRLAFSVDLTFIKFATGILARRTSRILACNIFLLLKCQVFRKEASGKNLIPTLLSGHLFSLSGTVYIQI